MIFEGFQRVPVPPAARQDLGAVAQRVFWWGETEDWLNDAVRFVAQVMTYGDWDDVQTTLQLLGDNAFLRVLDEPPPGVFDIKSWTYWHVRYNRAVPPLPARKLVDAEIQPPS